jgi:vitamin B12 transporter
MDDDAGYAGLQATLVRRLTLTAQARQDAVFNSTPFTWRLGAVADASEIWTHFKAAYGTAFRAPSLFDRYGIDSFGFVGNPNLQPEQAQGWEIGFTTDFPGLGRADAATFTATYFNNQVRNLIVTQFAPVYTAENIGSAHIQGVETELVFRPAPWATAIIGYTYTDAKDADNNTQLLRRPYNTGFMNLQLQPWKDVTLAPELLYTGPFRDFLILDNGFSDDVGMSRPGLIANFTATAQVAPQIAVYANVRNLFNSRFEPVNGYQTPGISFMAGTRVKF